MLIVKILVVALVLTAIAAVVFLLTQKRSGEIKTSTSTSPQVVHKSSEKTGGGTDVLAQVIKQPVVPKFGIVPDENAIRSLLIENMSDMGVAKDGDVVWSLGDMQTIELEDGTFTKKAFSHGSGDSAWGCGITGDNATIVVSKETGDGQWEAHSSYNFKLNWKTAEISNDSRVLAGVSIQSPNKVMIYRRYPFGDDAFTYWSTLEFNQNVDKVYLPLDSHVLVACGQDNTMTAFTLPEDRKEVPVCVLGENDGVKSMPVAAKISGSGDLGTLRLYTIPT
jgi:hypothetical protein